MRSAKFLPVLLMGAAGSALLAAAPATAQSNSANSMEEVVVTGSLSGVAHGLAQQRQATTVQDVISSDDFSKLPDFNAAEALQRLPGVSLVEQAGEGRFVSIRGAKPNYNGTMLDGFTIPSADRAERRVDLQTIPNALIERIEVNKTATPDIPTEGIGGSVNIVPRNPASTVCATTCLRFCADPSTSVEPCGPTSVAASTVFPCALPTASNSATSCSGVVSCANSMSTAIARAPAGPPI